MNGKPSTTTADAAEQISRSNAKWDGGELGAQATITYSFGVDPNFGEMTTLARSVTMQAMQWISEIANIEFVFADQGSEFTTNSSNGELVFQQGGSGPFGSGFGGWSGFSSVDDPTVTITNGFSFVTGESQYLILHELLHALGLDHPGNYDGSDGSTYSSAAPFIEDSRQYTVMSYWAETNTGADFQQNNVNNPMLFDIAALQRLYGANTETRATDTLYGFNSNLQMSDGSADQNWLLDGANDDIIGAVWDTGGTDTIDLSGYNSASILNLSSEMFSSFGGLTNNFTIAAGVTIENAIGGIGDDTLNGNNADNRLDGGAGNDALNGMSGNDLFVAQGNDTVIGGTGFDTVSIDTLARKAGTSLAWTNGETGAGTLSGTALSGSDLGDSTFTSVEAVTFLDGTYLIGNAARVQRLYDTVFSRDADSIGLSTWVVALEQGTSLNDVASGFTASVEFSQTYGALNTADFVNFLYQNVLDRSADNQGAEHWTGVLDSGEQSRAQVVVGFSESSEHIQNLSSQRVAGATFVEDQQAASVARLYYAALERAPDEQGLASWIEALGTGTSIDDVANNFTNSQEFGATYGSLDNGAFVDLIYQNVLNRAADAQGYQTWTDALASGSSRGAVLNGFAQSQEFIDKTEAFMDDGVFLV